MYKNKKEVDKHVDNLTSKLTAKEFKSRAYSVARLYFEVGDYVKCQKYVEQYLTLKDNNAAAYKLLGQALHKLGQKELALEHYKTSLDIDPSQSSIILDICEILADDDMVIEPGRAKYWFEKAEHTFPRHPFTFRLRERLLFMSNTDPESLINLLKTELSVKPNDALLHVRLLKQYVKSNLLKEAFEHSCNVEFGENPFTNNYIWYENLIELLKYDLHNTNDWIYQLLLLTVKERITFLSLSEIPSGTSKSLVESTEFLHAYDQAIEIVAKTGPLPGFGEFHSALLQHHRGQFAFHAATLLLKKAKKNQLNWRDATRLASPLMLIAWHTAPIDTKVNWLSHAPQQQQNIAKYWYLEGTYRCSQSGHYLLSNNQEKTQSCIDKISQCCSGTHWKEKLYEKIFNSLDDKMKKSHFLSQAFNAPILRFPNRIEVEDYDYNAQRLYGNSLHHFVWTLQNYKNYATFQCTLFEMLTSSGSSCAPETLNNVDIHAFLYFSTFTAQQQKSSQLIYFITDKPNVLPANITDLLCPLSQIKWWDCAYKFSQNELGSELTNIRATLSRGIEVVRCVDNHGIDPELLCLVGRVFSEKSKLTENIDEKNNLESRAVLYYSSAIPFLDKLKNKIVMKVPDKRIFDYTHKELSDHDLNTMLQESKLYVAIKHYNDGEFDKVIDILSNLKSPEAYYHLSKTYKKIAVEENQLSRDENAEVKSKYITLLSKAKTFAYKALDKLKYLETKKDQPIYSDVLELIEGIEVLINKVDPDFSGTAINETDTKDLSDQISSLEIRELTMKNNTMLRNSSSTPKRASNPNATTYRTAVDSRVFECTRIDQQSLERIENEIKSLQKRESTITDFMEQTKSWFNENRNLGNQIINAIESNIQNTTDQFNLLKISVNQVKVQIDECRNECKDVGELKKQIDELKKEVNTISFNLQNNADKFKHFKISVDQVKNEVNECKSECKDVGELKKQIAELKKEVNKLQNIKKSSEQSIDENDLYNLDEAYRSTDNPPNFTAQLPFTPQVVPSFNQRIVPPFPPNPYHLYSQSLYNLYNQYSQFGQPPPVPGSSQIFDHSRSQVNYPGVYPTSDPMYLDVGHLVPPNVPTVSTVPSAPTISAVGTIVPPITLPPPSTSMSVLKSNNETKEVTRSLPVNVVITSSDPLPTCTTAPAPVLSVTIPPKHIKGTPHNYQIPMPAVSESKMISPPVFSFSSGNKVTLGSQFTNSNNTIVLPSGQSGLVSTTNSTESKLFMSNIVGNTLGNSKSAVDGVLNTSSSPNASFNKSRTLSEKSNTSIENYDPCPDFKPIIPLPAEVKVTTGEEDEIVIFSSRAKLFRFVDKQWKERGLGEMKLLKHELSGKVRVLMRREQIHKVCANHVITSEMEIKPMKNETKAYFWAANDFADEKCVLEKFCIRFKTADIALEFYNTFENARQESKIASINSKPSNTETNQLSTPKSNDFVLSKTPNSKTTVGGFTFSSTPTFKTVADDKINDTKTEDTAASKVNVFSGFHFKSSTSSPFSNLFSTGPTRTDSNDNVDKQETTATLNTSDIVEDYEPNVEFKPVVPLPALIEQKTGEEDEIILFEHRAKLLRFDATSREWKERGLGNIKLLANKDNSQKLRLLMRREQIMKVCCNHSITKEMTFQKMPNVDKAVTWCAKDFSEGELIAETFCLRFKTVQTCDKFIEAIKSAQNKLQDESKAAKEEQNAAKQSIGFGDKFKSPPGAWQCETCYTNNLESFLKCACCEQPMPDGFLNEPKFTDITRNNSTWGSDFKPKPGTWECQNCLIRNEENVEYCSACNTPNDSNGAKTANNLISDNTPKYRTQCPPSVQTAAGWGNKFKPKEGTWECKQCFIRNENNVVECIACSSPKDSNAVMKVNKSVIETSGPTFNFGIPTTHCNAETVQTCIFDGKGGYNFNFGIPTNVSSKAIVISFGEQKPVTTSVFEIPKISSPSDPICMSLKKGDAESKISTTTKPALLPTPQLNSSTSFVGQDDGTFHFVFKPKTPPKGKSPLKSPKNQAGEESDGNEYVSEDEGVNIHFSPVIPLPEKVKVVTGEENEDELYSHRAKLFRYISGEWKERGIGIVKILKHEQSGKLRVVMRREQVLKICLNHALTTDITYTAKDDKTWLFAANDFSDGQLSVQNFCLRFKTKEIALEFKDAIDKALQRNSDSEKVARSNEKEHSEDVIFVSEVQATNDEKEKAKQLMLPENFFTYKYKKSCVGCRGCTDDADVESAATNTLASSKISPVTSTATPIKTLTPSFYSPTNSFYGTPGSNDKTLDSSTFRTPLGSITSNTKFMSPATINYGDTQIDTINKENTLSLKSNINNVSSSERKPITESRNVFDASDDQLPASTKSVLAPPKLSTLNKSAEIHSAPKSIYSAVDTKRTDEENTIVLNQDSPQRNLFAPDVVPLQVKPTTIFGSSIQTIPSTNPSIFGSKDQTVPVTSAFGSINDTNIFLSNEQTSNITGMFGPNEQIKSANNIFLSNEQKKPITSIFGTTEQKKPMTSIFGLNEPQKSNIFGSNDQKLPTTNIFGSSNLMKADNRSTELSKHFTSIFGSNEQTKPSIFGSTALPKQGTSIFGSSDQTQPATSIFGTIDKTKAVTSIFGSNESPKLGTNIFGSNDQKTPVSSIFGSNDQKTPVSSIFGLNDQKTSITSIFGSNDQKTPVTNIFGSTDSTKSTTGIIESNNQTKPITNIFGSIDQQKPITNIFGSNNLTNSETSKQSDDKKESTNVLATSDQTKKSAIFGLSDKIKPTTNIFEQTKQSAGLGVVDNQTKSSAEFSVANLSKLDTSNKSEEIKSNDDEPKETKIATNEKETLFKVDNNLTFAALSTTPANFTVQKKPDFQWEGAGQQLFSTCTKNDGNSNQINKDDSIADEVASGAAGGDEEYDPHYEPIVPLPDKIVVTTGEEDEVKIFGERCKLYRYDEKHKEWKERGVGEMKILYHPHRNTYRMLLRREQVHKAVLNMLLLMDLEFLPMKNSDRAWTWAGRNYAEIEAGNQETLAVRFKSIELANSFHTKVVECIRKLQAEAAKKIREGKESETLASVAPLRLPKHMEESTRAGYTAPDKVVQQTQSPSSIPAEPTVTVTPLRLPKHLEDSARADNAISAKVAQQMQADASISDVHDVSEDKTDSKDNGEITSLPSPGTVFQQVRFQEPEAEDQDEDDEEYDPDYYNEDDYNEDEEESGTCFSCEGEAMIQQGTTVSTYPTAHVQVAFDQDAYSPKILVTDSTTGEILADMLIHTDTEFQMSGDTCTWSGLDYTSHEAVDKNVTINFYDSDTAVQFYDSCESSKAATYSSTDPES